ncbi:hypothetical protein TCAL_16267, partial [Tigriopus californicus]
LFSIFNIVTFKVKRGLHDNGSWKSGRNMLDGNRVLCQRWICVWQLRRRYLFKTHFQNILSGIPQRFNFLFLPGFGVCCLFSVSGECSGDQTISQNCTYIQNNGYPAADTTVSETCEYNFERICDRECGDTADAITVTSPFSSSPFAFPPIVCGTLTGQHSKF